MCLFMVFHAIHSRFDGGNAAGVRGAGRSCACLAVRASHPASTRLSACTHSAALLRLVPAAIRPLSGPFRGRSAC